MINVTKTYAPSLQKYTQYLEGIWERNWFTNNGPLVLEFEDKIKDFLGVKHFFFVTNGTIALQIAIKALELNGNVITSPFSYVATTSSLVWEGCTPVFSDIDPDSLNISPDQIENILQNPHLSAPIQAIMAIHVYGNPSDVIKLEKIKKKYNLKLIYDAAHAFNVKFAGKSILNWGDISTLSFHSTKVFHTIEGGALITNDDDLAHKISYLRNFGHNGQEQFFGLGVNGKCSEMQAAMGLCLLDDYLALEDARKSVHEHYNNHLIRLFSEGLLRKPLWYENTTRNYGYYPVIFDTEQKLLRVKDLMNQNQIFPRRYFYPSLSELPYLKGKEQFDKVTNSESISQRALCLPSYVGLEESNLDRIAKIILSQY